VTANIARVGTAAGSTGAAADHVDSAARELGAQAARLRGDVDEFFGRIRSA
jgi:methyl-accepting chemotaxis protein